MWVAFANAFFSKNISIYAIFNDERFNNMVTNDSISFEQLGPATLPKQGDHEVRQDPPNTTIRQQTVQNMKKAPSKQPQIFMVP